MQNRGHNKFQNIDIYNFCIDINIAANFYRYINIADINDSSSSVMYFSFVFSIAARLIKLPPVTAPGEILPF